MYTLFLTALILSAAPDQPTEVIGSAATPDGKRHNVEVIQQNNLENPFGYVAETPSTPAESAPEQPVVDDFIPATERVQDEQSQLNNATPEASSPQPLVNQFEALNPTDMNPLDYENKIGNTIYQQGNRLIDVQSVPIKDINTALTPNIQPTVTDVPAF